MSENPDGASADPGVPDPGAPGREAPDPGAPDREETDLSTKLDPDFIPQQGDTPEVQRAREHPEETGS